MRKATASFEPMASNAKTCERRAECARRRLPLAGTTRTIFTVCWVGDGMLKAGSEETPQNESGEARTKARFRVVAPGYRAHLIYVVPVVLVFVFGLASRADMASLNEHPSLGYALL